jgi:hypothetical protein
VHDIRMTAAGIWHFAWLPGPIIALAVRKEK